MKQIAYLTMVFLPASVQVVAVSLLCIDVWTFGMAHSFDSSGCFWYECFRNQPGYIDSQEILRNGPPTNSHHSLDHDRLPVWSSWHKHLQTARMACIIFDETGQGLEGQAEKEAEAENGDIFNHRFPRSLGEEEGHFFNYWGRPRKDPGCCLCLNASCYAVTLPTLINQTSIEILCLH